MTHAASCHGPSQHGHDVILNQQIGETLGTVSTGEGNHRHGAEGQKWQRGSESREFASEAICPSALLHSLPR